MPGLENWGFEDSLGQGSDPGPREYDGFGTAPRGTVVRGGSTPPTVLADAADTVPVPTDGRAARVRIKAGRAYEHEGPAFLTRRTLVGPVHQPVRPSPAFVTVSDEASAEITFRIRSASDTVTPTDVATRSKGVFRRTAGDSAPAADAVARRTFKPRALEEDLPEVTDTATRAPIRFVRTAADSAPASDAVASPTYRRRTAGDSAPASDSARRYVFRVRTGSDSAPASDVAVREPITFVRAAEDSAPASDTVASPAYRARTTGNLAGASDSARRYVFRHRRGADSAPVTDAARRSEGLFYRAVEDLAARVIAPFAPRGLVQPLSTPVFATRSAPEVFDAADEVIVRVRDLADAAPASDSARRFVLFRRSASDSAPAADSVTRTALQRRSGADTAPATDDLSREVRATRSGHSGAPGGEADYLRLEALWVQPGSGYGVETRGTAARGTTPPDPHLTYIDFAGGFTLQAGDTVEFDYATETPGTGVTWEQVGTAFRVVLIGSEVNAAVRVRALRVLRGGMVVHTVIGPGVTPAITRVGPEDPGRVVLATRHLPDHTVRAITLRRSAGDGAPATDLATRFLRLFRTATDAAPAADDGTRRGDRFRTATETVTPTDAATRNGSVFRRLGADLAAALDAAARRVWLYRSAADSAPAEDEVTYNVLRPAFVREDLPEVTDEATRVLTYTLEGDEDAPAEDSASRWVYNHRRPGDSAPATDAATRQVVFARTAADTAPAADTLAHLRTTFKTGSDSAPASDAVDRRVWTYRSATDAAPVLDLATRALLLFRSSEDSIPRTTDFATRIRRRLRNGVDWVIVWPVTDAATRRLTARRSVAETLPPATDSTSRVKRQHRLADDTATATDWLERMHRRVRTALDPVDRVRDLAVRVLALARAAQDFAWANDVGTVLRKVNLSEIVPPVTDEATRQVAKAREGFEVVPEPNDDHNNRVLLARRRAADLAPAADQAAVSRLLIRSAADLAPVTDAVVSPQHLMRRASDTVTVLGIYADADEFDKAKRLKRLRRRAIDGPFHTNDEGRPVRSLYGSDPDWPEVWDPAPQVEESFGGEWGPIGDAVSSRVIAFRHLVDDLPLVLDLAHREMRHARALLERLPLPGDRATVLTAHRIKVGPPHAHVSAVERVKLGWEAGCEGYRTRVNFYFDQPVDAYTIRLRSTNHQDGVEVAAWNPSVREGFGIQAFGRYPFGRGFRGAWLVEDTATITAEHLLHGENTLVIYGRSLTGLWSVYPSAPNQPSTPHEAQDPVRGLVPTR